MEYSTISILDYFKYTLANVGLPEYWQDCDLNGVTWIETKSVKCESNQIGKKLSQIELENVS